MGKVTVAVAFVALLSASLAVLPAADAVQSADQMASEPFAWRDMGPSPAPSPRESMPLAYDSSAGRFILFGGLVGGVTGSAETWAYDPVANAWENRSPAVHPSARWLHGLAFDVQSSRTILFGGGDINGLSDETWAYDYGSNTWTQLSPATHPSMRSRMGMAYDAAADRVLLFGGLAAEGYVNDTWAFDFNTVTWTELAPADAPSPRRSMGFTYDSVADRILLFGGLDATLTRLGDTWAYDSAGDAWTNLNPADAPSPRYAPGLVYASASEFGILFGGSSDAGLSGDTWAYNASVDTWTPLSLDPHPSGRWLAGMAYADDRDLAVLFGGDDGALAGDTWALGRMSAPPGPPQDVSAVSGDGFVDLRWSPPADPGTSPVSGYRVYRAEEGSGAVLLAQLGNVGSYHDGGVTNGRTYSYWISAANAAGEGPRSSEVFGTPDGLPPQTTASLIGTEGSHGWFVSPVTVALSASDDFSGVVATRYRIDAGSWVVYREAFSISGDGRHALDYFSEDAVGNIEPVQSAGIGIDTAAPTTTAHLDGTTDDGMHFRSEVRVRLDAADATSGIDVTRYSLDGGTWTAYSDVLLIGEGEHTLRFASLDLAGLEEAVRTVSFVVDQQAPSTAATFDGPEGTGGWFLGPVQISLEAADADGVAGTWFRIDGTHWARYASPFTVSGDGSHTVDYYSVDVAGNVEGTHTTAIRIDGTPPSAGGEVLGAQALSGWYVSATIVVLQGGDAQSGLAGVFFRIDGGSWQTYTGPFDLSDGTHNIDIFAMDQAGNPSPSTTLTARVDQTPPATAAAITGGVPVNGWYGSAVSMVLSGEDSASGVSGLLYRVDGGAWTSYAAAFGLGDGAHLVEFYATNGAGLVEPVRSVDVYVDLIAPVLQVDSVPAVVASANVAISWDARDSGSGIARVELRIDNGSFAPVLGAWASLPLADGPHRIHLRAVDRVGHATEVEVSFRVAATSPAVDAAGWAPAWFAAITVAAILGAVAAAWLLRRGRHSP